MKSRRNPTFWIYIGTAITMLIAIGIFSWSVVGERREGGGTPATAFHQSAATFFPPTYKPVAGAAVSAGFQNAMALYEKHDFAAAIPVLKGESNVASKFYLGICDLYTGNRTSGIAELREVIAAGNTPYLERAHFYLAKGMIGAGDVAGARRELDQAIALHGDLEQQAEAVLARLK